MADILREAFAYQLEDMEDHASRTVTYRQGADSVSLTAIVGETDPLALNRLGMDRAQDDFTAPSPEQWGRDYMVRTADLLISGAAFRPKIGDFIDDTNDVTGETWRFRVEALPGQPHYVLRGYALWIRIHTKFFQVL